MPSAAASSGRVNPNSMRRSQTRFETWTSSGSIPFRPWWPAGFAACIKVLLRAFLLPLGHLPFGCRFGFCAFSPATMEVISAKSCTGSASNAREINTISTTSTRRNPRSISETKVCFLPSRSAASVCVSFARRRTAAKHAPTSRYCSGSIRTTGSISCWICDPIGFRSRWAPMLEVYRIAGPKRDRLPFLQTRQSGLSAAARGECAAAFL